MGEMGNGNTGTMMRGWEGLSILNEERRCMEGGVISTTTNNNSNTQAEGSKDPLYTALWHACAGPLVTVPRIGEKVFYFPQGHTEQVQAYTSQNNAGEMPIYNLPSKILCGVANVQLKADIYTDEVFTEITLVPEERQDRKVLIKKDKAPLVPPQETETWSFSKILTASDTSTHGGFSVPKRQADECLPPLDMSQQPPVQDLVAKDLHGVEWRFRHIYRGQPRRHLLTSGWSTFVAAKKLAAGDSCIFIRGSDGELRVGIRRATRLQGHSSASVISGLSMQHGILASAYHALSSPATFSVYYRPWTCPSEFIIPYDKYIKCMGKDYSVGTRFKMMFEGEDCSEQRYFGTITGMEDIDPIRWPRSEWRCLKVQWDSKLDKLVRPERVCLWNIEHMDMTDKNNASPSSRLKRQRTHNTPSAFSPVLTSSLLKTPFSSAAQGQTGVLRGQDMRVAGSRELGSTSRVPFISHLVPHPHTSKWSEAQLLSSIQNPFYQHSNYIVPFSDAKLHNFGPASVWPPTASSAAAGFSRNAFAVNLDPTTSEYQTWRVPEVKDEIGAQISQTSYNEKYRLFGVNILGGGDLPQDQNEASSKLYAGQSVPPTSQSSISESVQVSDPLSNSASGLSHQNRCKKCFSIISRSSCIKVLKYGTTLGRTVDINTFDGYDGLIAELDQMFDFKGELIDESSDWCVSYVDDEGDNMLIGSFPWQEFKCVVQRIYIYPNEEAVKDDPSSGKPTITDE